MMKNLQFIVCLTFLMLISTYINGVETKCSLRARSRNKALPTRSSYQSLERRRTCAVQQGIQWLLDRRNTEWGWGERQEAEAIIALHLASDSWFNQFDSDSYISVKQMNIDLLVPISMDNTLNSTLWSHGKLGQYICGLKATCQDPRNFYGHDLIQKLEAHMANFAEYFQGNKFAFSWAILAICNSNEIVKDNFVNKLIQNPGKFTFGIDEASMVLMALSCINTTFVSTAKTAAEDYILHRKNIDGSFGNEYTTGLAIQSLIASGRTGVDNVINKALDALINMQAQANGGFKNVAAANQVLPALARKSFTDIGKVPCVDIGTTVAPTSGNLIEITISVEDNLFSHVNQTWTVVISSGITLYDALKILQNQNTGFSFQSVSTSWGHSIKSIIGVAVDSSKRTYWSLNIAPDTPSKTGVSSTYPKDKDHYIFRMATY